jgi:probable HAF family extracellular repeat protein
MTISGKFPCVIIFACLTAGTVCASLQYEIVDLGTLGGPWGKAWDINSHGQVVGVAYTDDHFDHAAKWELPLGPEDLGTLGGARSRAHAINDSGAAVG